MPYSKRKFQKKYKKKYYKKNISKIVSKIIDKNTETKEMVITDVVAGLNSIGTGSLTSVPLCALTNLIVPGNGFNQRIGNTIFLKGIRYYFPFSNLSADTFNRIRWCVIMPHKDYPGTATVGQFINDVFGTNGTWNQFSPINTDKYKVLVDKFILLKVQADAGTTSTQVPDVKLKQGYIKINKQIRYEFDGSQNSNRPTTEIYSFAISDSNAVPNPGTIGGFFKLYYKDA